MDQDKRTLDWPVRLSQLFHTLNVSRVLVALTEAQRNRGSECDRNYESIAGELLELIAVNRLSL
jgi:hypothetical protein